jgi:NAD(P)-dependent dehydrogenase (short-subunit alcohol dehydrogenase family)/3-hydroxymyristoyl/3-hydroxydecanoyl-(acyl carrier protein) dehydratase
MLDINLDMEADLGIDTVKQAELFAAIRDFYSIPRKENLSLKDYPTINHCIKFVLENTSAQTHSEPIKPAEQTVEKKEKAEESLVKKTSNSISQDEVKEQILNLISEKTGYPKDMLDINLDMEADLGIDTVKQAELFAAIRDFYSIPRKENLSLKDYPTINHCIKFVLENTSAQTHSEPIKPAEQTVEKKEKAEESLVKKTSNSISQDEVKEQILNLISEKTGYPKDMLDINLDMEADLGIDTVKQAELFAAIRDFYSIPRKENLSLKDYPTINHCIKFVLENTSETKIEQKIEKQEKKIENIPQETKEEKAETKLNLSKEEILSEIINKYPKRHIRYIPTIKESPVTQEIIKKLDTSRPAIIIGEDMELIRLYKSELTKLGIESIIICSHKTRIKDTHIVNFDDMGEVEKTIKEISEKNPKIGGIIYLMGCIQKPLDASTNPMRDMHYYAMPLFIAAKYFNKTLNEPEEGKTNFVAIITTLDGQFGYLTKKPYDPVYASIFGISLCLRKEIDKCAVKLIDFENDTQVNMVKKTFYEIQYSDLRHAVCYKDNKRYSLYGLPGEMDNSKERYSLKGKKIMVTGGGRGLGALFSKIIANRWQPEIIIMDIIEQINGSEKLSKMSEKELDNYKKEVLLKELREKNDKVTPAILEKEFTKLKDSANLYKTIEELKLLGSKVKYYRCDLNNPAQFNQVMDEIKKTYDKIDGIVHFAGLERSKLIVDKTIDEFDLIFKTKAQSAINLWKANIVKENGLWVMISSIAGKFGNLGQSDYAAASDYISKFAINLYNKGIRAFSIDMTGIANIGMGARPGVEAFLKSQNLEFLYPQEVMNALADEIAYGNTPEVILSGDLGKLDWDKQLQYESNYPNGKEISNTGLHFVEKAYKKTKGKEFEASKTLSVEKDNYLKDHSINSTPVFPGVMGLETFAETVYAFENIKPLSMKNIKFQLPVKLLKNKPIDIRIKAAKEETIKMQIESDFINSKGAKMGETRIHFLSEYNDNMKHMPNDVKLPTIKSKKYKINSETIYKTYFHGPSFQVLDGILNIDKESVIGVFKKPQAKLLGENDMNYIFHPMIIEAVFQTCGWRDIYLENKMTLPDQIGEIYIKDNNPDPEKLYTCAIYKGINDYGKSIYDAYSFNENGEIIVYLKNYLMIPTQI